MGNEAKSHIFPVSFVACDKFQFDACLRMEKNSISCWLWAPDRRIRICIVNSNCFGKVAPIVKCLYGDEFKIREFTHWNYAWWQWIETRWQPAAINVIIARRNRYCCIFARCATTHYLRRHFQNAFDFFSLRYCRHPSCAPHCRRLVSAKTFRAHNCFLFVFRENGFAQVYKPTTDVRANRIKANCFALHISCGDFSRIFSHPPHTASHSESTNNNIYSENYICFSFFDICFDKAFPCFLHFDVKMCASHSQTAPNPTPPVHPTDQINFAHQCDLSAPPNCFISISRRLNVD